MKRAGIWHETGSWTKEVNEARRAKGEDLNASKVEEKGEENKTKKGKHNGTIAEFEAQWKDGIKAAGKLILTTDNKNREIAWEEIKTREVSFKKRLQQNKNLDQVLTAVNRMAQRHDQI